MRLQLDEGVRLGYQPDTLVVPLLPKNATGPVPVQLARTAKAAAHTSRTLAQIFGTTTVAPKPLRRIISEGFFVGATNPKGLIILTAVLPQFMDRAAGHATLQIATFGAICIAMSLLSDGAWAIASGTAR